MASAWEGWTLAADYHTHTRFSHGQGSILDNVAAAARAGLAELGICDHGPALLFIGLRSEERLAQMRREVEEARVRYPSVKVLLGMEANVISPAGDLDISERAISRLDILLVGLHPQIRPSLWKGAWPLVWNNAVAAIARLARGRVHGRAAGGRSVRRWMGAEGRARSLNTRALVGAVRRYPVMAVTHAGLKMDVDMEELAAACAERGTAIEINSLHGYPTPEDLEVAMRYGVRFIISSDAHSPSRVGCLQAGLERARAAGIAPHLVWNARPPARAASPRGACELRGEERPSQRTR
ncbi:MAG: PHP domain-containing protein [Bacillota bacterium]